MKSNALPFAMFGELTAFSTHFWRALASLFKFLLALSAAIFDLLIIGPKLLRHHSPTELPREITDARFSLRF